MNCQTPIQRFLEAIDLIAKCGSYLDAKDSVRFRLSHSSIEKAAQETFHFLIPQAHISGLSPGDRKKHQDEIFAKFNLFKIEELNESRQEELQKFFDKINNNYKLRYSNSLTTKQSENHLLIEKHTQAILLYPTEKIISELKKPYDYSYKFKQLIKALEVCNDLKFNKEIAEIFSKQIIFPRLRKRFSLSDNCLMSYKEVILNCIKISGGACVLFKCCDFKLPLDDDIISMGVKSDSFGLQPGLPITIIDHDKLILAAVTKCGIDLEHVSSRLKNDKRIVLAAVTRDGRALQFASEELKNDEKVVRAAIEQNEGALRYASQELQDKFQFEKAKELAKKSLKRANSEDLTESSARITKRHKPS